MGSASRRDLEGEITFAQLILLTALPAEAGQPSLSGRSGYRQPPVSLRASGIPRGPGRSGEAIIGNPRTWHSAAGTL
jgi:hypothetical protein